MPPDLQTKNRKLIFARNQFHRLHPCHSTETAELHYLTLTNPSHVIYAKAAAMNSRLFAFCCLIGMLAGFPAVTPAFAQPDSPVPTSSTSNVVSIPSTEASSADDAGQANAASLLRKTNDSIDATSKTQAAPLVNEKVSEKVKPQKQKSFALTFDDIKFDMKKTDKFDRKMLTEKINGYHGGKVKIRGYIRPNLKQDGIRKFIFVRDNKECCFGEGAAIFDNILVRMAKNKTTRYTVRPITIEGNFVLKEYVGPGGDVWSLYRMYDAEVK